MPRKQTTKIDANASDSRSILAKRLERPAKTDAEVRLIQQNIGMVLLDNAKILDGLSRVVMGFNGSPGLVSLATQIAVRVESLEGRLSEKTKPRKDHFDKVVDWFIDKILPTLIIVILSWGFVFALNVWLHVQVFGTPTPIQTSVPR